MFYGLTPWFEIMGFFVAVVAFFTFLSLFCLDKYFSMIWKMDDSVLCSMSEQSLAICMSSFNFEI